VGSRLAPITATPLGAKKELIDKECGGRSGMVDSVVGVKLKESRGECKAIPRRL
jgi:hypothetical protein